MKIRTLMSMAAAVLAVFAAAPAASASASAHQVRPAVGVAADSDTSGNAIWTGYLDQADPNVQFRYVTSNFTVPSVNCTTSDSFASWWVGLDGYNESTVEQDGVGASCSGSDASYFAWYEIYAPTGAPQQAEQWLGYVNPGDSISASVYFINGVYDFNVYDHTTRGSNPWTAQAVCPQGYTCPNDQAEVISEAHPDVTLPRFTPVTFIDSGVTSRDGTHGAFDNAYLWTLTPLTQGIGIYGTPVEQASGLSNGGGNFTVTWDRPIG